MNMLEFYFAQSARICEIKKDNQYCVMLRFAAYEFLVRGNTMEEQID